MNEGYRKHNFCYYGIRGEFSAYSQPSKEMFEGMDMDKKQHKAEEEI